MQKNKHYFLGSEELLSPNINKCDAARVHMFINHMNQALILNEPEVPNVFTNFENMIGKYSSGYKKINENFKIIDIFKFNENRIVYLIQYVDSEVFDILEMNGYSYLSEDYGYLNNNTKLELDKSYETAIVLKNTQYDDKLNLSYGVNLKTAFLSIDGKTYEDGIIVSESASKKLSHTSINKFDIMINKNDVLLNVYGDSENYIPLPEIGSKIENNVLAIRRRLNYDKLLHVAINDLTKPNILDSFFYAKGKLLDIKIYNNLSDEDMDYEYFDYINILYKKEYNVFFKMDKRLKEIQNANYKYTDNFSHWLVNAHNYVNREKYISDKKTFDGILIECIVANNEPLKVGSKITNRMASKGVVSEIRKDENMPKSKDGIVAEVILNPLSIINRLNISALYELELNYIMGFIKRKYKGKELLRKLYKFFYILNKEQFNFIKKYLKENKPKNLLSHINNSDIPIHQPPFYGNVTIDILSRLIEYFNVDKMECENIVNKLIIADVYFIKLRHEPDNKMSARSTGYMSIFNTPLKNSENYKKGNALYNNNPLRMGEQEYYNLCLLEDERINTYLQLNSSSVNGRETLYEQLMFTPLSKLEKINYTSKKISSNSVEIITSLFKILGIKFKNK